MHIDLNYLTVAHVHTWCHLQVVNHFLSCNSAEGWGFNLFSRGGFIPVCLAIENRFCLSLIYCSIQHPAGKLILPLKRWMSLCFHLWGEWTLSSTEEVNHTTLPLKWWMWLLSNWRDERMKGLNEEVNVDWTSHSSMACPIKMK